MERHKEHQIFTEKLNSKLLLFLLFCYLMVFCSSEQANASHASSVPNDPWFSDQWYTGSYEENFGNGWIEMYELLERLQTPAKKVVRVAVIDSGLNVDHEDISKAVWINEDEVADGADNDGDGYVDNLNGCAFTPEDDSCLNVAVDETLVQHGTGTAGLIAAAINNELGIAGMSVGFEVEVVPLKVIQQSGVANYSDITAALAYVKAVGDIDVVSINIAGWPLSPPATAQQLITELADLGVIIVAGSGNSADLEEGIGWPASHPRVIAVGGYNRDGQRRDNSSYGPGLALVAPADWIRTTCYTSEYCAQGGTSFAGPQVAAAAAFAKAFVPDIDDATFRELLVRTSGWEWTEEYGYGPLDFGALAREILLPYNLYIPLTMYQAGQ